MSYKTAIGAPPPTGDSNRYRSQARQLQELFPSWSNDDLQSLLHEVAGDVELAATQISEGHAEQWGAVTRKKDKKPNGPTHVSSKDSTRGELRGGARGGARGGRGGSFRGGSVPRARGGSALRPANGHHDHAHPPSSNAWADGPPGIDKPADKSLDNPEPAATSSWTDAVDIPSATPASWGNTKETEVNGSALTVPHPKALAKTPATSKMSWAQIARPQEKPTPSPTAPAAVSPPPVVAVPEPEPQPQTGWEEPTTVQTPSWEEEAPVVLKPSNSAADVWASANEPPEDPKLESNLPEPQLEEEAPPPPVVEAISPPLEPEPARSVPSPSPSIKPSRPAASSHRNSARYKITDQAVVMPSSFGSGIEKVGMQFGSLSLGGETSFDNAPEPEAAPEPQPQATSPRAPQVVAPTHHEHTPPQATVPPTSASLGSALFQQGLPPQAQVSSHTLPSSVSQPVVSQKSAPLTESLAAQPVQLQQEHSQLTPQQQYMQQHMAAGGYVPPHLQLQQQQQQQQSHSHQYSQHGLPTHIDPSQPNPQLQAASAHSNYFRNEHAPAAASSPYFHAPTPPAGQTQDTPYGAFGQLGGQGQHQQGGHISGFGQDYGHDNQRGFYDTYQPSAFNRGVLGHEDVKGLSGGPQQQPNAGGLPPSGQTTAQHGNGQNAGQQQQPPPAAGPQGQQYAPPLPYYYPYPQNQYYGAPYNSGYSVPPYVKYPAMFPGPPGPGSGPAPGQQGQTNIGVKGQGQAQGQGGYGPAQGLYQSGYDDYTGQPQSHAAQHQQQQQQHSLGLGQGGVDYGKPLYGGGQGFMGLGGQGGTSGPQGANTRGGSPETQYKPYGKDVGVAARASQQGQGQGQQQAQGQGQAAPQGQGFYGGNRFGGVGGAGGSGPQQNAHAVPAAHLGYSQAQNDFYPYQGRQQQYWQ
ncbi:hypothetical protein C8F01DRAFT_1060523 [Mycena amicta]|nr:hypothetical protein C8F01DRAFT_1060523 [Mycena amicta]